MIDGTIYEGNFVNDKYSGKGKIILKSKTNEVNSTTINNDS